MSRTFLRSILFALAGLALTACGEGRVSNPADDAVDNRPQEIQALPSFPHLSRCPATGVPGEMHCMATIRTDTSGNITPNATPQGLGPADLAGGVQHPRQGGSGMTIAIVDAQDDPNAESDLATYRAQFGLPGVHHRQRLLQEGEPERRQASPLPDGRPGLGRRDRARPGHGQRRVPELQDPPRGGHPGHDADLGEAREHRGEPGRGRGEQQLRRRGVVERQPVDTSYYNHPGVAITASAGDDGYGVEYPAASPYVTAVGGTTLAKSSSASRGWVESAWGSASNANGGTGSGLQQLRAQAHLADGPPAAASAWSPTSPPWRIRTPGVAVYDGYGSGGWHGRTAAPARPARSSRRSSRSPATSPTRSASRTRTPPTSTT